MGPLGLRSKANQTISLSLSPLLSHFNSSFISGDHIGAQPKQHFQIATHRKLGLQSPQNISRFQYSIFI
jgi:hypothetical protein